MLVGATGKRWSAADRLLAVALTELEACLCSGCGHPKDRAYHPGSTGHYEPRSVVCNACAAQAEHKSKEPGERVYVVDTMPDEVLPPWQLGGSVPPAEGRKEDPDADDGDQSAHRN